MSARAGERRTPSKEAEIFTLARLIPVRELLLTQLVPIGVALVIAEAFYKFGSFSLECLAFLATWLVLDGIGHAATAASARLRAALQRRH